MILVSSVNQPVVRHRVPAEDLTRQGVRECRGAQRTRSEQLLSALDDQLERLRTGPRRARLRNCGQQPDVPHLKIWRPLADVPEKVRGD
jgi:hypothetical protein